MQVQAYLQQYRKFERAFATLLQIQVGCNNITQLDTPHQCYEFRYTPARLQIQMQRDNVAMDVHVCDSVARNRRTFSPA